MLERLQARGFDLAFLSHARAILEGDFPDAVGELETALADFTIPMVTLIGSGGGETSGTQNLRRILSETLGWTKHKFQMKHVVDSIEHESVTHEIDHVKAFAVDGIQCNLALEIEWNNKDPFFDRDLDNFKRLHAEGAISVGIIVTRGKSLQEGLVPLVRRFATEKDITSFANLKRFDVRTTARQQREVERHIARGRTFQESWANQFVSDKFGAATTHWDKLKDRVDRGVGNPCPLLLIGLSDQVVTF